LEFGLVTGPTGYATLRNEAISRCTMMHRSCRRWQSSRCDHSCRVQRRDDFGKRSGWDQRVPTRQGSGVSQRDNRYLPDVFPLPGSDFT